jgi:hypothetical protein
MNTRIRNAATTIAVGVAGVALAAGGLVTAGASASPGSDALGTAQAIRAGCQAWLTAHPGSATSQATRMRNCVADESAIITALTATPSPSPTPSQTPTGPSAWPGGGNTGVPAGVQLAPYTVPGCTISTNTTLDAKLITGCGTISIRAKVAFTRSKIVGQVICDYCNGSLTIVDSEVDGGTIKGAAVSNTNVTVLRSNIHGAAASVQCGSHCTVTDSWLHGQYMPRGADWHDDAFITNGGTDMTLTHNTIACDEGTGACSGDVFLAADFERVTNDNVTGNLLVADANVQYCTYGGSNRLGADHIVYRDNVFQRGANRLCGRYGPVTIFDPNVAGNVWQNNRWDTGELVPPSNAGP